MSGVNIQAHANTNSISSISQNIKTNNQLEKKVNIDYNASILEINNQIESLDNNQNTVELNSKIDTRSLEKVKAATNKENANVSVNNVSLTTKIDSTLAQNVTNSNNLAKSFRLDVLSSSTKISSDYIKSNVNNL